MTPEEKPTPAKVSEASKSKFRWWLLAPILVVILIGVGLAVWQPWSGTLPANVPTNVHKICQVTDDGGIDDKSYNAAAWKGVEDAKKKYGLEVKYLESQQKADYEKNISLFIEENCDLIITVGSMLGDTTKAMAQANPDRKFSIVDVSYSLVVPNVLAQVFTTDQVAFLAGYVAAATTRTGKVATFGGMQIPPVTVFMDGFWYGVKYYNDQKGADVSVLGWNPVTQTGIFAGNFESLDDGYGLGLGFLNEGVDIILPVAGPVGQGTAAAVKDHGNAWIIGVDTDWTKTVPKFKRVILTSILKNMDATTFEAIEMVINGNFHGGVLTGDLTNNGVDIAPVASAHMTSDLQTELETIRAGIIAGTIQTRP